MNTQPTTDNRQLRIDSHVHFWHFDPIRDAWITEDMSVIRNDFLPKDFEDASQKCKMSGCIAVQADQSLAETHFLLDLVKKNSVVKGVVGWIDLKAENLRETLESYSHHEKLCGFRHIVQGEKKGFLLDSVFQKGVAMLPQYNFTYDLLIYEHQLEESLAFIQALPKQKIIIDHIAKPIIKNASFENWAKGMTAIAAHENVYCKVSGMVTEADWAKWKREDFTRYLDLVFDVFGVNRIVYGSDWPVCLLAATYQKQFNIVEKYCSRLSENEKPKVFGGNAVSFYHLSGV